MTDNVIKLVPPLLGADAVIDADVVLDAAKGKYTTLVLVGEREDGEIEVAGTHRPGDAVILLQYASQYLVTSRTQRT